MKFESSIDYFDDIKKPLEEAKGNEERNLISPEQIQRDPLWKREFDKHKVGDKYTVSMAAPGYGKIIYLITKKDTTGLWGKKISNNSGILEPWMVESKVKEEVNPKINDKVILEEDSETDFYDLIANAINWGMTEKETIDYVQSDYSKKTKDQIIKAFNDAKNILSEKQLSEIRSLVHIDVYWDGKRSFTLNYPGGGKVFNGSAEGFEKFLRKIGAVEGSTLPRSGRTLTYKEIVQNIMTGKDPSLYAWVNRIVDFPERIINESRLNPMVFTNDDILYYEDQIDFMRQINKEIFHKKTIDSLPFSFDGSDMYDKTSNNTIFPMAAGGKYKYNELKKFIMKKYNVKEEILGEEDKWITSQGIHIKIDGDGNIKSGPKNMKGKNMKDLEDRGNTDKKSTKSDSSTPTKSNDKKDKKTDLTRKSSVTLDFEHEGDDPKKELDKFAKKYGVTYKIIKKSGPSGGFPEVKFDGELGKIKKLAKKYYDDPEMEDEEMGIKVQKESILKESSITVDFAYDGPNSIKDEIEKFAKKYGVSSKIVTISGMGGGWPEVKFTGDFKKIIKLAKKYYDEQTIDKEDYEDLGIEESLREDDDPIALVPGLKSKDYAVIVNDETGKRLTIERKNLHYYKDDGWREVRPGFKESYQSIIWEVDMDENDVAKFISLAKKEGAEVKAEPQTPGDKGAGIVTLHISDDDWSLIKQIIKPFRYKVINEKVEESRAYKVKTLKDRPNKMFNLKD